MKIINSAAGMVSYIFNDFHTQVGVTQPYEIHTRTTLQQSRHRGNSQELLSRDTAARERVLHQWMVTSRQWKTHRCDSRHKGLTFATPGDSQFISATHMRHLHLRLGLLTANEHVHAIHVRMRNREW